MAISSITTRARTTTKTIASTPLAIGVMNGDDDDDGGVYDDDGSNGNIFTIVDINDNYQRSMIPMTIITVRGRSQNM